MTTDEIGEKPRQGIKTVKELKEAKLEDIDNPILRNIKKKIDKQTNEEKAFFSMLEEIEKDLYKK